MVALYTGNLGSGKTLFSVCEMLDHIEQGGVVATNVKLYWNRITRYMEQKRGVRIHPEQFVPVDLNADKNWHLQIPWGVPGDLPVLCVLDELHLFFNSRKWQETQAKHEQVQSFLTQSRKACVDVRFIVQADSTLDRQMREQAEFVVWMLPNTHFHFGWAGSLPGNWYFAITRTAKTNKFVKRQFRKYDPAMFTLYKSHQMLDETMLACEQQVQRLPSFKLHKLSPFQQATVRARKIRRRLVVSAALWRRAFRNTRIQCASSSSSSPS